MAEPKMAGKLDMSRDNQAIEYISTVSDKKEGPWT
jgi:hypothetical protein